MHPKPMVVLGGLALLLVASARADTAKCPNTKAKQVAAASGDAGSRHRTCGIGFVIFGVGGGLFGEDCPATRTFTPAHQECSEPNEGTACVPDDDMSVTAQDCACGPLIPLLEIGIPVSCICGPQYNGGTVEDAKTAICSQG